MTRNQYKYAKKVEMGLIYAKKSMKTSQNKHLTILVTLTGRENRTTNMHLGETIT